MGKRILKNYLNTAAPRSSKKWKRLARLSTLCGVPVTGTYSSVNERVKEAMIKFQDPKGPESKFLSFYFIRTTEDSWVLSICHDLIYITNIFYTFFSY